MTTTDHTTEAATVEAITRQATTPTPVEPGALLVTAGQDGTLRVTDTDRWAAQPRRKTGTVAVLDAEAFIAYIGKHGGSNTEVWADVTMPTLLGVINAHDTIDPGWGDHVVKLRTVPTVAWTTWIGQDRNLLPQVDFAEHVEDRIIDFVEPVGAEMLELAQTFTANRSLRFESSQRVKSGETQLVYKEEQQAAAGRKGNIAIPDTFTLALRPFEGCDAYKVTARLRYRISDGRLTLGYVLDRPEDVLRAAFEDIVTAVGAGITQPVWHGIPSA